MSDFCCNTNQRLRKKKEKRNGTRNRNHINKSKNFRCGNKKAKIEQPKSTERVAGDKFEKIKSAIESYSTDRLIKSERELETVIYEYLRHEFPIKFKRPKSEQFCKNAKQNKKIFKLWGHLTPKWQTRSVWMNRTLNS